MKIVCTKDYQDMSRKAAMLLSAQIIMKPNAVLGLATGSTPIGLYAHLVEWCQRGDLDFSEVTTINLDEYRGLPRDHVQSYRHYMYTRLFDHINIHPENIHIPDGTESDPLLACAAYDVMIQRAGGIDLQLLGIGLDGHIGFNEPGTAFELGTHCVDLTESTLAANQRFFASREEMPKQAYTMGVKTIMQAKKVLMVASGKEKAAILKEAFLGRVTPQVPASILQMHPDFTLMGDQEALQLIL